MIKLIVSDLDGTLVNDKKEFAPDFFEILKELKQKAICFTIASGRSKYTLEKTFESVKGDILYISDNGGYISGKTEKENMEEILLPLTHEQAQDTVAQCLKVEGLQIIMCAKDKAYFVRIDEEYLPVISYYYIDYEIIEDYTKIEEQILKVAVFDPKGSASNAHPRLKDKLDKELVSVVSSVEWMDIMNKNLNKGLALKQLQQHLGVTKDETMVFGDYNNDIEMLKCAKYSYAMQNSSDNVKKAANYTAPSNNDFGVAKIIKEKIFAGGKNGNVCI